MEKAHFFFTESPGRDSDIFILTAIVASTSISELFCMLSAANISGIMQIMVDNVQLRYKEFLREQAFLSGKRRVMEEMQI